MASIFQRAVKRVHERHEASVSVRPEHVSVAWVKRGKKGASIELRLRAEFPFAGQIYSELELIYFGNICVQCSTVVKHVNNRLVARWRCTKTASAYKAIHSTIGIVKDFAEEEDTMPLNVALEMRFTKHSTSPMSPAYGREVNTHISQHRNYCHILLQLAPE